MSSDSTAAEVLAAIERRASELEPMLRAFRETVKTPKQAVELRAIVDKLLEADTLEYYKLAVMPLRLILAIERGELGDALHRKLIWVGAKSGDVEETRKEFKWLRDRAVYDGRADLQLFLDLLRREFPDIEAR